METEKQVSIMNYYSLSDVNSVMDQHVDTSTQTGNVGTSVRFLYFNPNENTKQEPLGPLPEEEYQDLYDDEKQKGRSRNPDKWKQNVRKKNKNQGLEYVRANGELSARKQLGPPCTCKMKCYKRIGEEACKKVFNNFWKLGDHSLQNAYIAGCVRIFLPKHFSKTKNKDQPPSRRFYTRYFYVNVNGVDTEICKQAFLNLHSISNGRLDRLLKKKQEDGNTGVDARGRHNNKVNKVPFSKIREVRRSIDGFRKRAGFIGKRKSKTVEILPGPLNIRSMYRTYCEEEQALGHEPVCEFRFRKIFHNDFHIEFSRTVAAPSSLSTPPVQAAVPSESNPPPLPVSAQDAQPACPPVTGTYSLDDKPVYTTLEAKDTTTNSTATYVMYNSYSMPPHSWIFPTQS